MKRCRHRLILIAVHILLSDTVVAQIVDGSVVALPKQQVPTIQPDADTPTIKEEASSKSSLTSSLSSVDEGPDYTSLGVSSPNASAQAVNESSDSIVIDVLSDYSSSSNLLSSSSNSLKIIEPGDAVSGNLMDRCVTTVAVSPCASSLSPLITLLTAVIGIVGLCINIYLFTVARRNYLVDKAKERESGFSDEFWLRKIAIPEIQSSLNSFAMRHVDFWRNISKNSSDVNSGDYLKDDFQRGTYSIIMQIESLNALSSKLSSSMLDSVVEVIDDVDTTMAKLCEIYTSDENKRKEVASDALTLMESFELKVLLALKTPHSKFLSEVDE